MIWAILGIGFVLRLVSLNQSLWLDEASQVMLSARSLYSIFFDRAVDFHPPLSYILMHFWLQFNTSEIWLRFLSVIFGVLTIWVLYKLVSILFNKRIGIVSALLLSIGPYHIYYSQEIRMYAEAAFFATVSMDFLLRILRKEKISYFVGYILSTTALLYTHYDGLFLVISQLIYLLLFERNKINVVIKNLVVVSLLGLFWIPEFLKQFQAGMRANSYLPGWDNILRLDPIKAIPLTIVKYTIGRISIGNTLLYSLIIFLVLVFIFCILIRFLRYAKEKNYYFVLCWFFVPLILSFLVSFKVPMNQPFRLLFIVPAFYLILALGLSAMHKLEKLFLLILILISLLGLSVYFFSPKYWREDWRSATIFLNNKILKNDLVIFAWPSPFPPYEWYDRKGQTKGVVTSFPAKLSDVENQLNIIDNKNTLYLFEYLQDLSDPNKFIQLELNKKRFLLSNTYNFNGVGFIYEYTKD